MEKRALFKRAAELLRSQDVAIRQQLTEISTLTEKLASYQRAEETVSHLLKFEELEAESVLKKLSEYRTKTAEDLTVLNKAFDIAKGSPVSFFGKVAEVQDTGFTPEEKFINFLIGEN
jgi:hypothetical protein